MLKYEFDKDRLDRVIDEKGNQFIAMRFARWKEDGDYQLEIRRFALSEEGETPLKGIRFLTDEGPDELTKALLENGFGNVEEISDSIIIDRPAIAAKIYNKLSGDTKLMTKVLSHEEDEDEEKDTAEYYDPKEMLA